jgi:uncharacterized membrane protein
MTTEAEPDRALLPRIRRVGVLAPLRWLAAAARDYAAHPWPSVFYGACFAAMAWSIVFTFRNAFEYVSALVTGFYLIGPFLAIGLYDLSRRRERGEAASLRPTLTAWRRNAGAIGVFALILTVILLVWARASLVVFALFYSGAMPTTEKFFAQLASPGNAQFLIAYAFVGGLFAMLTFATSVVSIPMMLDRPEDGVVAVLTSVKAFGDNLPAMLVWGSTIIALVAAGFAMACVGLVVAVPLVGHATWHAYRELVEGADGKPEAGAGGKQD